MSEMPKPVFWKRNKKNVSICCLLNVLPRVLSVNMALGVLVQFQAKATLSKLFCFCSEKGSILTGNNLLSLGAKFFFRRDLISGTGSHKSYLPCKIWRNIYQLYPFPLSETHFFVDSHDSQ